MPVNYHKQDMQVNSENKNARLAGSMTRRDAKLRKDFPAGGNDVFKKYPQTNR
jgi:hypothetical protein